MSLPEAYRAPAVGADGMMKYTQTDTAGILKPVFGAIGTCRAQFKVHRVYSGEDSKIANREVYRDVEVCMIKPDRFSEIPKRVEKVDLQGKVIVTSELSTAEQIALAPLYDRFLTQKDSTESLIETWQALQESERQHLLNMGVFTIEQLFNFKEHELSRLGSIGRDLHKRAERHMNAKNEESASAQRKIEMEVIRKEREEQAAERQAYATKMEALEAKIAELEAANRKSRKGGFTPVEETA